MHLNLPESDGNIFHSISHFIRQDLSLSKLNSLSDGDKNFIKMCLEKIQNPKGSEKEKINKADWIRLQKIIEKDSPMEKMARGVSALSEVSQLTKEIISLHDAIYIKGQTQWVEEDRQVWGKIHPEKESTSEVYTVNDKQIRRMPPDGDCQLHSILEGLRVQYPQSHAHLKVQDLRKMGMDYADREKLRDKDLQASMGADMVDYNKATKGKKIDTFDTYIQEARKSGFWCGAAHLHSLSATLKVPIIAIKDTGQKQVFNASKSTSEPIEVFHHHGNHYDYIIPKTKI